jgi:glycosyltransferase involved in cell wall biosynthesis
MQTITTPQATFSGTAPLDAAPRTSRSLKNRLRSVARLLAHAAPGPHNGGTPSLLPKTALKTKAREMRRLQGEVADAILATGLVNGPVHTIDNAIELPAGPAGPSRPPIPLLVAGWKDRGFTDQVVAGLRGSGFQPEVIDAHLPREEFLARLAAARVVVLLPLQLEGCFLPALEAFALGCLVVCPDCVGNRQFCRDGDTCFRPAHDPRAIVAAAVHALALAPAERERIVAAALAEAGGRGLDAERRAFLAILENLDGIW